MLSRRRRRPDGRPAGQLAAAALALVALVACSGRTATTAGSSVSAPPAPPTSASAPPPATAAPTPPTAAANPGGLTDEQLVGQLFVAYVYGSGPDTATAQQRAANTALYGVATPADVVRRWHVGGVMLFGVNNLDPARAQLASGNVTGPAQITALTAGLQAAAQADTHVPLVIATDQEGGRVARVRSGVEQLPAAQVLGAQGAVAVRCAYYRVGTGLRALGIDQDYAPDADVVRTSTGVIGDRSFGPDPSTDAQLVTAATDGLQAAGVLATLKHWPGHGSTSTDSHLRLAVVSEEAATWRAIDRVPFAAAAAQAAAVMVGHLAVPALDPSGAPATLSPVLVQRELRDGLGYRGLVVTDSLWMAPVRAAGSPGDVAVRAVAAGQDMLLQSPDLPQAFATLLARVRSDPAFRSRVADAVTHVLAAKQQAAAGARGAPPGC